MVNQAIKQNAEILEREIQWFYNILDTRIKIHFGHESDFADVFEINPPEIDPENSIYGKIINHYQMDFAERVIFFLSLVPHIRPQILDIFFTKNASNSMDFTEFGGRNGHSFNGFLPTGETAMFILTEGNLEKRIKISQIFNSEHFFDRHSILSLEHPQSNEPDLSGFISVSKEVVDLVTTGVARQPTFGMDFPAKKN